MKKNKRKMNKSLLIFLLALCTHVAGMAQDIQHCGQEAYMHYLSVHNPSLYKQLIQFQEQLTQHARTAGQERTASTPASTVITIPVVVHVIHNNSAGTIGGNNNTNISDAQIFSQIDALNKDYLRLNVDTINTPASFRPVATNCRLAFCMASLDPNGNVTNGITRTYSSQASFAITDDTKLKALSDWPSDQYLNIWVCNLTGASPTQILLGYTQPPGGGGLDGLSPGDGNAATDGVVINYKAFGTVGTLYGRFNLGRTATHEIGHWFGLLHPWGNYDSGDCSLSDYCDDTPTCGNAFESASPTCLSNPDIDCSDTRMIQNYMEYSDDGCMNLFTKDQSTRMHSVLQLSPRRAKILSSIGCCTITTAVMDAPYEKSFENGDIYSDNWSVNNANSGSPYTKGFELSHVSAYGQGSFSIAVANDSVYSATDPAKSKYTYSYVSPYMNLGQTKKPYLHFDWAYSPLTKNGNTDSIVVSVSTGCADIWEPLYTFYGNSFSSTSNPRAAFIPAANEWMVTDINMSAYVSKPAIRIRFVAYSKGINTFYLDNINIASTSANLVVNTYPNPTPDFMTVETLFTGKKNVHYAIYNVLGQSLYQSQDTDVYSTTKHLDLSGFAAGLYFIQISDGDSKTLKRIIKL